MVKKKNIYSLPNELTHNIQKLIPICGLCLLSLYFVISPFVSFMFMAFHTSGSSGSTESYTFHLKKGFLMTTVVVCESMKGQKNAIGVVSHSSLFNKYIRQNKELQIYRFLFVCFDLIFHLQTHTTRETPTRKCRGTAILSLTSIVTV